MVIRRFKRTEVPIELKISFLKELNGKWFPVGNELTVHTRNISPGGCFIQINSIEAGFQYVILKVLSFPDGNNFNWIFGEVIWSRNEPVNDKDYKLSLGIKFILMESSLRNFIQESIQRAYPTIFEG
ncbi:MAG: PilZ domain-containing protein [Candidatus Coatesbacteria bacterium]|nr:PilZ domain-containing protein [Candidatus Coatesbacteria bacterium]